jgi:UDP-2,3-diacylglucosamine pyrophosphatase LpxH
VTRISSAMGRITAPAARDRRSRRAPVARPGAIRYDRRVRVRSALVFSDVHLGWVVCAAHHAAWLARLPAAVDDAELVVLNGDVIDGHRRAPRPAERGLVDQLAALVAGWRREGRRVVYLAGNHDEQLDPSTPLRPDGWRHAFEAASGERVLVLHGHRFAAARATWARYDGLGRRVLAWENRAYARSATLRRLYGVAMGRVVSLVGRTECGLARRRLPRDLAPVAGDADVVLHGHIHYGPGRGRNGRLHTWRTGSWVSPGHLGTADRMLRYRHGRFERIGWSGGRWRAHDDGR